jgi:hypothetical protein
MSSQEFIDTLSGMEPIGIEEDDENYLPSDQKGDAVIYDEIDSSKTIDEEVIALMTADMEDGVSEDGEVCVGTDLSQFIGHEFTATAATNAWMKWNVKRSH